MTIKDKNFGWRDLVIGVLVSILLTVGGSYFAVGQDIYTNSRVLIQSVDANTEAITQLEDTLKELGDIRVMDRENFIRLEDRVGRLEEFHPRGGK